VGAARRGQTTLARILAGSFDAEFIPLSAVFSGVKDIRDAVEQAHAALQRSGRHTILFVDEVHRFNKSQQDAFCLCRIRPAHLYWRHHGKPSFEVNSALLSRAQVYVLNSLGEDELVQLFQRTRQGRTGRAGI
jgi:putative ATPase